MRRRAIKLVVAMVEALVVGSGVALAAAITCGANPCLGTDDPDFLLGTNAAEEIRALAGNDDVAAQYGNDTVNGGPDGNVDIIDCGKGSGDVAHIDRRTDKDVTSCETILRERVSRAVGSTAGRGA